MAEMPIAVIELEEKVPVPEQYRFTWRGTVFERQAREAPAFSGDGKWGCAFVAVDGWRWSARLSVNNGIAAGYGPTPWQALDAAVVQWQSDVEALTKALAGEAPAVPS